MGSVILRRAAMILWAGALLSACAGDTGGGGDADVTDSGPEYAPESMWGTYDVRLLGDWVGSCTLMISTGAIVEDLVVDSSGWELESYGQRHANAVEPRDPDAWAFIFEYEVIGIAGPEQHRWEYVISESEVTEAGFTGTYRHQTETAGTLTGELRATRQ